MEKHSLTHLERQLTKPLTLFWQKLIDWLTPPGQKIIGQNSRDLKEPIKSETWESIKLNLNDDQKKRLWEHHLHADTILYSRLSFFITFELVLLGLIGVLLNRPSPNNLDQPVIIALISLGIVLTGIWGYIQARQTLVLERSKVLTREVFPEYRAILEDRDRPQEQKEWPWSSVLLLKCIPFLIAVVWVALLIYMLFH